MNLTADMENTVKTKARYKWVDNVKFACCVLVVLGHTFMGIAEAGIIEKGSVYNLLIQSVYTFHVPLFFVCSGFLYQKSNRVHDMKSWGSNLLSKLIGLGVPYFVFSLITLFTKLLFKNDVNTKASSDILNVLFVKN